MLLIAIALQDSSTSAAYLLGLENSLLLNPGFEMPLIYKRKDEIVDKDGLGDLSLLCT